MLAPFRTPSNSTPMRPVLADLLLLVGCAAWAYANSFSGTFVFDDRDHLPVLQRQTPAIRFTVDSRPLTAWTFHIGEALLGKEPWAYHAGNLLIHLTTAMAFYALVRQGLSRTTSADLAEPQTSDITHRRLALATASLWAVHPLTTESVTYIVQRAEALAAGFCLLALLGLGCYSRSRHLGWAMASIVACWLGCLSKEAAVATPLLAWLYDCTLLSGSWRACLRRHGWIYAAYLTPGLALLPKVLHSFSDAQSTVGTAAREHGWLGYAIAQPWAILHYVKLAVWPHPLSIDYGWPTDVRAWQLIAAGLVLVVALGLCLSSWWNGNRAAVLGLMFFAYLAPRSSVLPHTDPIVEHRMYLPLMALICAGVVSWHRSLAKIGLHRGWNGELVGLSGLVLWCCVALGWGRLTALRNEDYRSTLALWTSAAAAVPTNPRARLNLAIDLHDLGRQDAAEVAVQRYLQLKPDGVPGLILYGEICEAKGRLTEAAGYYQRAADLASDVALPLNNLGRIAVREQRWDDADRYFELASQREPRWTLPPYNRGVVAQRQGRLDDAAAFFREALQLDPGFSLAALELAHVLATADDAVLRNGPESVRWIEQSGLLSQMQRTRPWRVYATALAEAGRFPEALAAVEQALRLARDDQRPAIKVDQRRLQMRQAMETTVAGDKQVKANE